MKKQPPLATIQVFTLETTLIVQFFISFALFLIMLRFIKIKKVIAFMFTFSIFFCIGESC